MFGLGFSEIVLLSIIVLVVVGPKQLPEVARTIGRFLNEFKRGTDSVKADLFGSDLSDLRNPVHKIKEDLKNEILGSDKKDQG